jgi:SNF2 family DNA or RNA helicase
MSKRHFFGNFSGMGSGKTLTALEAARLALKDELGGAALIIAPPIALPMWAEEAKRHLGARVEIVRTGKQTPFYPGVVVMSYAIATKRIKRLAEVGWSTVIMDESHALKSPGAKRTQALLGDTLTHGATGRGLLDSAEHVWVLTGTPMTRWPDDLYPFLLRADPEGMKARCGGTSIERFWLRYCVRQNKVYGRKRVTATVGARNTIELNEWIYSEDRPLAVRRRLQDVWDQMPPLTKTKLVVPLESSPELKLALAALKSLSQEDIENGLSSKDAAIAEIRRIIGEAKVTASVEAIAERVDAGSGPVLVGTWHRSVIAATVEQLKAKGLRVAQIQGDTPAAARSKAVQIFNSQDLDVLVGQIASMGVSLNLQAGGNCIMTIEEDWSPAMMDQFYARLHRLGQQQHVHVDTLVSETPLDEAVSRINIAKKAAARQAIGA